MTWLSTLSIDDLSKSEIARRLNGHVRRDGCVAFPGPGRKPADRSCTLKLDASAPGGVIVADARREIDWRALKDYVRERVGLPEFGRRSSRGLTA